MRLRHLRAAAVSRPGAADLDECYRVGAAVREAAAVSGKRVVFVASTALSHKLARTPESWPLEEHQAQDRRFVAILREGRTGEARRILEGYARETSVEMGGRNIASMLGALDGVAPGR